MKDRRGDVVGEIAVDSNAAAGGERGEVGFEDVRMNHAEAGIMGSKALQAGHQRKIELDGDHRSATFEEMLGHFAMASTNFYPAITRRSSWRGGLNPVRGHANCAGDFLAPARVAKEVLTESLSAHGVGRESVAGGGARLSHASIRRVGAGEER